MGSLGLPEIAFIFVLALLIFGPKKLPEIGRTVGRGVAEFRRATNELKRSINTELALDETPIPPALHARRLEDSREPRREAPAAEPAKPDASAEPEPGEAPPVSSHGLEPW
ncbi:MAG TPA: twin-arginine translocase TatA/TatE family subunit [Thermoanaerobaculia bacterium]|jgi:TatA/E family protein of Tat protein translocase|nr:twin-arginine translocase TatA/TatE family subunit [Thermoanaerobaculia bacterium]